MKKVITVLLVVLFACGMVLTSGQLAAEEPWSDIQDESFDLVVGFDAGGSHDLSARYLQEALAEETGIDIDVVNMPGGIGTEAGYHVSTQDPDENIMFWGHPPAVVFDPATEDVGYTYDDLDPVAAVGTPTFVLAAGEDAPFDTLDELIEYIEENPGEVVVGSQGELHLMHYAIEFILPMDELDYNYVALAGGADVQSNLAGGHIDVGHMSMAAAKPLHDAGDLTAMVHTSEVAENIEMMPDVPHVSEYGIEFTEPHYLAAWSPAGTDREKREALNAAMEQATQNEEFQENMEEMGFIIEHNTVDETEELFGEYYHEELLPGYVEWLEEAREERGN